MRDKLTKIKRYIFRGWDNEPTNPHPIIKLLPPLFIEVLSYLIGVAILIYCLPSNKNKHKNIVCIK